jgi:hypothetical protein
MGLIVSSGFRSARCAFAALLDGRLVGHFATVDAAATVLRLHGATEVEVAPDPRFCPLCGADIDGNDPHGPGCPNGEGGT